MSNAPSLTSPVYATDEDVASEAGNDFVTLCRPWDSMAAGTDGAFAAGSPWTLTSASVDFQTNGVAPNMVVWLSQPKSAFPGSGALLAVDTVTGGSIGLRRIYQGLGVGQPPGPVTGLTGATFSVPTMSAQIASSCWGLKRRFGIDENITYRGSSWIYDLRDLREAAVLETLIVRYTFELRGVAAGIGGRSTDFGAKLDNCKKRLDDVLARVQIRWGPQGNSASPSTLFSCKVTR